ncbi:DUF6153 family protein [Nocardioides sp. Soil796]
MSSAPGRSLAKLLVLVGVLAGLLAMHGLTNHGAAGHEAGNDGLGASATSMEPGMSHAGDASADASLTESPSGDPEKGSRGGMAMVGLCLAVLVGFVIGYVLRRPTHVVLFRVPRALRVAAIPVTATRDRDPPCLFELSVLRT